MNPENELNLERLADYEIVCIDTETTGLRWYDKDKIFGIAIAAKTEGGPIVSGYYDVREQPRILQGLKRDAPRLRKVVNQNIKFDLHMLRKEGINIPLDRVDCTGVRAALINEHDAASSGGLGMGLDDLCKKYLGETKDESIYADLAAMFGGKPTRAAQMPNLHRAPVSLARRYALRDPVLSLKLFMWQEHEIAKQEIQGICALEREMLEVLVEVEEQGIRVDEDLARRQLVVIRRNIEEAQHTLNKIAGKEVNANSSPQMRALFNVREEKRDGATYWYTDTGFLLENTDGGDASLGKKSLETMAKLGDERAKAVQVLRKQIKATQFLKDHILGHAVGGRVYPNYNQTRGDNDLGTGTGRFSINEPAMQQIPARDRDIAALVRPCFLPEKGHQWSSADWEQFEFRWFAHYTNDPQIIKAYADNPDTDYHKIVSDITGIPRNPPYAGAANAKQINLGLVFGMGEGEMAYQMGLDYTTRRDESGREWKNAGPKAKGVFSTYHGAIPGVKQLLDQASSIARARGFVKTVMGRRIRFPGGKFTHKAAGLVFQGTSADCLKLKMIRLHKMGKKEGFRYLLCVHDEHNTSHPVKMMKKHAPMVKRELELFDGKECPIACRVPIRSSLKTGANWHEASKKE
jgi:DNA polymerase I-like protein with 3'-5' exonuclease and polymerase domains